MSLREAITNRKEPDRKRIFPGFDSSCDPLGWTKMYHWGEKTPTSKNDGLSI